MLQSGVTQVLQPASFSTVHVPSSPAFAIPLVPARQNPENTPSEFIQRHTYWLRITKSFFHYLHKFSIFITQECLFERQAFIVSDILEHETKRFRRSYAHFFKRGVRTRFKFIVNT
ncbi:hypothetical protein AN698_0208970 [Serratia marcescens]|nr:hypothetical protein AN701_0213785 [Serratia marcescens]OCO95041.1 hypothetical protein AN698_0208970 [Serratia marcescens]